jgi:hypothetical protein
MKRVIEAVYLVAEGRTNNMQLVLDFQEGDTITLGAPLAYAVAGAIGNDISGWPERSIEVAIRPVEQ